MKLSNKNVLITGGAGGLGHEIALRFSNLEGANVGILDIDKKGVENIQEDHQIWSRVCDVTDQQQVERAVEEFIEEKGSVDVLINNAGSIYSAPLINILGGDKRKHSLEKWDDIIRLNLRSVFILSSTVADHMIRKRTKGVIVNISSISAKGNPGQGAYSASKAAVEALTVAWGRELGIMGIRVVAIAPGFMDTPSTKAALSESVLEDWIRRVPLRRLGKPEEVCNGIISIIENDYFNAQTFVLDGGLEF